MKDHEIDNDPELQRQMAAASDTDSPMEAVFFLSPDNTSGGVPSPERTEELTHELLSRVQKSVGKGEKDLNIFRNLGSFVVSAHPSFLKELMLQPEVASVMANQQPEAPDIGPVKKRSVPSPAPDRVKKSKGSKAKTRKNK